MFFFKLDRIIFVLNSVALTLNGVKLVLKELASFHATAQHFINTYPGGREALSDDYKKLYDADFFEVPKKPDNNGNDENANENKMKGFFHMISQMFGTAVVVTKKFGSEDLADRMSAYHKKIIGEMVKLFMMKWRLCLIVHGDAWYNNFLFRYIKPSSHVTLFYLLTYIDYIYKYLTWIFHQIIRIFSHIKEKDRNVLEKSSFTKL